MNANNHILYPIVKLAIIVGIRRQTELATSFIEHAIKIMPHQTTQFSPPEFQTAMPFLKRLSIKIYLVRLIYV